MTPHQLITLGQYSTRLLSNTVDAGRASARLASQAAWMLWRVTRVTLAAPLLAADRLRKATISTLLPAEPEAEPQQAPIKRPVSAAPSVTRYTSEPSCDYEPNDMVQSDSDDSDCAESSEDSGQESDEDISISSSESEPEDHPGFKTYKECCKHEQDFYADVYGASSNTCAGQAVALSQNEQHIMTLTFNINEEQLQHELEEYNREQAENAEFLSVVSRSARQEQCTVLDDELSPTALVSSLKNAQSPSEMAPDEITETPKQLVREARISAVRNNTGLARLLDLSRKNSPLKKLLKSRPSINPDEYQDIACIIAQNLQGQTCNKTELAKHLNNTLLTYRSRIQRLMPAIAGYLSNSGISTCRPLGETDFDRAYASSTLNSQDKKILQWVHLLGLQVREKVYAPINADDYFGQIMQLNALLQQTKTIRRHSISDNELSMAMVSDLDTMADALKVRLKQLQTIQNNDQRTLAMAQLQAKAWEDDATLALQQLGDEFEQLAAEKARTMTRVQQAIYESQINKTRTKFRLARERIQSTASYLQTLLKQRQQQHRQATEVFDDQESSSAKPGSTPFPDMIKVIDAHVHTLTAILGTVPGGIERLNQTVIKRLEQHAPLRVSEQTVPLMIDGEAHDFRVRYTPAKDIQLPLSESGNTLTDPVGLQGRFPCSANRNSSDAQNLMLVEAIDQEGELVRRDVRVGTLVPYLEKNVIKRRIITKKRRDQALTMLLAANHQRVEGIHGVLQNTWDWQTAASQTPVKMPFTYICYLSPDQLRRTGIHENEHLMVEETRATLDELRDQPHILTVHSPEGEKHVPVEAQPTMFVFPANMLGFNPKLKTLCQTYRLADQINDQAMASLIGSANDAEGVPGGDVGRFLSSGAGQYFSQQQRQDLIALCNELRTVITQRLYHHGGKRPFYPSWLVEQITERLNHSLLNGCKSAKDRTNNAAKSHLADSAAAHIRATRTGQSSSWQRLNLGKDSVTGEMAENQTVAHLTCGALEQQRANCGKAGYKVDGTARGLVHRAVYHQLSAS